MAKAMHRRYHDSNRLRCVQSLASLYLVMSEVIALNKHGIMGRRGEGIQDMS